MVRKRISYGLEALAVIIVVGVLGYVVIERVNVFDALYMVVITITTVGFGEAFELSDAGRLWTMFILVSGFGIAIFTAVASIEYLVDLGEVRKKNQMEKNAAQLSNHVILCGWGRVGRGTWHELNTRGIDTVVVESVPERVDAAIAAGALVIAGDATHNDVLEVAGIHEAQALIACVADDSDNLVIALSVKALRTDIRVICRATEAESERKLRLAGADAVVAPQAVGAERIAALAIQPELAQIFDVVVGGSAVEFHVEELDIEEACPVKGRTIRESGIRQESGALILAVEGEREHLSVNPGPEVRLQVGDRLIVVGTKDQVKRAADIVQPPS
ncbi:MAG: potassium channel protein [Acidimicrobiia bacterium]